MTMPWVHITSNSNTWLKKVPVSLEDISSSDKAQILSSRTLQRCQILDRRDGHTQLEINGIGDWWVLDEHWDGLNGSIKVVNNCCIDAVPYIHQIMDDEGWDQSQSASISMCLRHLNIPSINSHNNYLKVLNKYGKSASRYANRKALRELSVKATFSISSDDYDIKSELNRGRPVVAGILMRGSITAPVGTPHFVVIFGHTEFAWRVHDPFGKLDLVKGTWLDRGVGAGKDITYDFEHFNRRFMNEGGATGRMWSNFYR